MSLPEISIPKMATPSWTFSATSIKAAPPSAWSPTTLDMPATQSVPSIFLTEESPKKPKRLHCKVKQRSHEAQPVNLGKDSWPSAAHHESILGRLRLREQVILRVGRARWAPGREFF